MVFHRLSKKTEKDILSFMQFLEKNKDKFIKLLWVAIILASTKSLFTDTGFDNAYTVAMSYRHLSGDHMFQQMWEPHQTSIFFTDFFMWLYHLVVPSYTGVMLYLQIVGTLFFGVISFLLYRTLSQVTTKQVASLAAAFFFIFRAKQTPFPDFANLQIGFSALLLLCLVKYLQDEKKWYYLCLAALCLCLEVLSYPSCILAYIAVVIVLFCKSKKSLPSIGIFTATCAAIGLSYAGFFILRIGFNTFFNNLRNIFYADSHSTDTNTFYSYFHGILISLIWLACCAFVSRLITFLYKVIAKKELEFLPVYGILLLVSETAMLFLQKKTGIDWTCVFYILPVFLMILGAFYYRHMNEAERTIWLLGILLSASSFVATWMLTDLGLITIVSYMVLGGVVSFLPLRYAKRQAIIFLLAVSALATIHRGLVVWGYANKGNIWMVQDMNTIIRSGPSLGIMCDYMTYYQITCDEEDHRQFVTDEDHFLLVGGWLIDSMEFLLSDAGISNYSTIDTPIYNEKLLEYFELYPDKTPTVVAVSCWYGELMLDPDSFVMKWVEENYETVGDGRYWRYYRLKNQGL